MLWGALNHIEKYPVAVGFSLSTEESWCSSRSASPRPRLTSRPSLSFRRLQWWGFYPIEISLYLPMFPRPTASGVCECQSSTSFRSCRAPSRPIRCLRWILPYFHWIGTKSRFPGCQNKLHSCISSVSYCLLTVSLCPEVLHPYYFFILPCLCTLNIA